MGQTFNGSKTMSACYANHKQQKPSVFPEMAKELIFWSAVFVVVATSAVLVSQMDADWSVPLPFSGPVASVAASTMNTGQASPTEQFSGGRSVDWAAAAEPVPTF
jgi:hypothetical protein